MTHAHAILDQVRCNVRLDMACLRALFPEPRPYNIDAALRDLEIAVLGITHEMREQEKAA